MNPRLSLGILNLVKGYTVLLLKEMVVHHLMIPWVLLKFIFDMTCASHELSTAPIGMAID
ncbi:hypothetical protein B5C28_13975 [Corynebacterium glutamicum]|nr:hypothetical protein B5C28_13975 [Corynebacterium glutamicum]